MHMRMEDGIHPDAAFIWCMDCACLRACGAVIVDAGKCSLPNLNLNSIGSIVQCDNVCHRLNKLDSQIAHLGTILDSFCALTLINFPTTGKKKSLFCIQHGNLMDRDVLALTCHLT